MKKVAIVLSIFIAGKQSHAQSIKPTTMAAGKAVYGKACITCHQPDAKGVPGLNPPLVKTKWVLGNKTALINIILKGLNTPIEIDDEYYANPMPAQSNLTDEQIADVLTYVRNSFGNKATTVTVAEVKTARAKK